MACYSEQTTSQLLTLNCQFVEQALNSLVFEPLRRVCLRLMNLKRLCKYRVSRTSAFSVSSVNVSSLLHTQAEVFNTFLATFRPDNTTRTMHQQRSLLLGRSSCSSGFCFGALQVRSPWGARLKQVLGEVVELFPSLERRVYATIARPFRNCWSYTGFLWFDEVRSNVVGVCERQRFSEVLGRHKVSSCKIVFVYIILVFCFRKCVTPLSCFSVFPLRCASAQLRSTTRQFAQCNRSAINTAYIYRIALLTLGMLHCLCVCMVA